MVFPLCLLGFPIGKIGVKPSVWTTFLELDVPPVGVSHCETKKRSFRNDPKPKCIAPWFLMAFLHSFPGAFFWGSCWTLQQFHLPGAPMVRSGQSKPKLLQSYGILLGDLLGMFIVHLLKKKIPVRKGGSITPYEIWWSLLIAWANRTSQSWSLGNLDKSATLDSGPHVPASRSCEKVSPKPPWPECGGVLGGSSQLVSS